MDLRHPSEGAMRGRRFQNLLITALQSIFRARRALATGDCARSVDAQGVAHLLADVEASLRDIDLITKPHAGPCTLLPVRLDRLGIDADQAAATEPEHWAQLASACSACTDWRSCARDLAADDAGSGLATYCRNGTRIAGMLETPRNPPSRPH